MKSLESRLKRTKGTFSYIINIITAKNNKIPITFCKQLVVLLLVLLWNIFIIFNIYYKDGIYFQTGVYYNKSNKT